VPGPAWSQGPIKLPGFDPIDEKVAFADADLVDRAESASLDPAVPLPGESPSNGFDFPDPLEFSEPSETDFGNLEESSPPAESPPESASPNADAPATLDEPSFELLEAPFEPVPINGSTDPVFEMPQSLEQPVASEAPAPNFQFDGNADSEAPAPDFDFGGGAGSEALAPDPGFDAGATGEGPTPDFEFDGSAASEIPAPEFDLHSAVGSEAPQSNLELDPSADPPPAPGKAADESLEMLSFNDSSPAPSNPAPAKPAATRYQVRRKGGKIFGPFDQPVLANMLRDGQLTGLEDVSSDGQSWSPIGSVPEFEDAIPKLSDAPAEPAEPAEPLSSETSDTMERLKRVYEGRMATVHVVHGGARFEKLRSKLPILAAGAAAAVLIIAGASLGFTRYGPFGLKRLFPARVSRGSTQHSMLEDARKALWADTYKSYRTALELSLGVLKVREYPEARAIWSQAVFYLDRRYGAASPGELEKAKATLEEIRILGQKHPELIKAAAGAALAEGRAAQALTLLQEATARTGNSDDLELSYLLADCYAQQGQRKLATEGLNRILSRAKGSAKALHSLAALYQAANELDQAAQSYAAALEADPNHLSSALELGWLELKRKNLEKVAGLVERLSAEATQSQLAPMERARARALKGATLALQGKRAEAVAELDEALKLDSALGSAKEQLAALLLDQHLFARALPLYKELMEKESQNLAANHGYLTALIGAGKATDALVALAQVSTRFPADPRIAYLYGRANDEADKGAEAEKHYRRALNADPKLVDASLYLSRLFLRFRRIDEAKAVLEQALASAPDDAGVHAGVGELALAQVDTPRAKSEFQRALELDPRSPEGHLGISRVALEEGTPATARSEAEKALELDPVVRNGRLYHGIALWRLGELDAAVTELQKAKAEDSRSSLLLITLSAVLLEKGDVVGAENNLLLAQMVDSLNPEVYFYLAKAKAKRGEYSQSIETMKTALERGPNQPRYHYQLGVIYRDAKRGLDAIQSWKRAVELDPSLADASEALGQAYLDRGEYESAMASFEQALKTDPRRTRILGLIGDCYFQASHWDKAIARYLVALKADDSLKHLYYRLGRAYTEKGKHGQAIAWYTKALEADRQNPMTYYYLAYAYKDKHSRKEAIEAFKNYLELKADAEDRKEIEDEIYDLQHE
jgi:tetratricopeptide (TPR) repeat protein